MPTRQQRPTSADADRLTFRRFFAELGPGLVTGAADDDPSGISTYSVVGASFGYLPLWTLLPITLLLIVTQEMCSRMGALTLVLARPGTSRSIRGWACLSHLWRSASSAWRRR